MNPEPNGLTDRASVLAWLAADQAQRDADRQLAPYLNAAALLATFKLEGLQPDGHATQPRADALLELINRSRPVGDMRDDIWQLDEAQRRSALRRLSNRDSMRRARRANPGQGSGAIQQGIDLLIAADTPPRLDGMVLDQLLGLERALKWFEGVVEPLPKAAELEARIERERQLAPMRKLLERGFVDRVPYLVQLADYVGVLPPASALRGVLRAYKYIAYLIDRRPPLHLHGPGGIGKSALLAKFILEHADPDHAQPLPFVYLDFDRGTLDPRQPQTLLDEAIRQLLVQFPEAGAEIGDLSSEAAESSARLESVEPAKGNLHQAGYDSLVTRFSRLLELISSRNQQPVLIVLDTLEEAEYHGESAMRITWGLLAELLRRVDRLRIVTAGRSELFRSLQREPVEVTGLEDSMAVAMVVQRSESMPGGPLLPADAQAIVKLVGTVPLSLALAANVVLAEGIDALRDTVGRQKMFTRIRAEQQQGMLYRRILDHVKTHSAELEKLANPGLIVRRITRGVIENVLAGPCKLALRDSDHAQSLFDNLAREVGLVDAYRESGALWHLPAVRRIMLPDLRATLGGLPRLIHESAVTYYQSLPGEVERAEAIYHRLCLGDSGTDLDALWQPELARHLRGAYEELDPPAKLWLADKLGIELSAELRAQADQATWERQAEQRVRVLLAGGLVEDALQTLDERPLDPAAATLHGLKADALKLLGRRKEAVATLDAALVVAGHAGNHGAMLPLLSRLAFLHEAGGLLAEALQLARRALALARGLREERLEELSAGVALLRLSRKLGTAAALPAAEVTGVRGAMYGLLEDHATRAALRSRPALLMECAAELGRDDEALLVEAVSTLGITPDALLALQAEARQRQAPTQQQDALDKLLPELLALRSSRGIGQRVALLVPLFPDFFARHLAQVVDSTLDATAAPRTRSDASLSSADTRALIDVVMRRFESQDLELLAHDLYDLPLNAVINVSSNYASRVQQLVGFARQRGTLGPLVQSLARSRPDDDVLRHLAQQLIHPRSS